ncbi:MAG: hypothetical protein LUH42_01610 [Oscillospiraceae bacterium]|nr:hypothetical protein [Oscillospiraceae bacterium]
MFISATESARLTAAKTAFVYLLAAVFCMVFGAVYEHFSHDVYSGYMIYAFAFPLLGGAVPFCAMTLLGRCPVPTRLPQNLYHSGIATLTVGSVFQGVLEIYGTTSRLMRVYWTVGIALTAAGAALYLAGLLSRRDTE